MSEPKALETFLTRFAAGAGTLFTWHLTPEGWLIAQLHDEADLPEDWPPSLGMPYLCPLTAQATLEGGRIITREQVETAVELFALSSDVSRRLMDAADNLETSRAPARTLRARLLRICGLVGTGGQYAIAHPGRD